MTLFVSQFGSGRPLLCLHGIEAHGLRFVALATLLSDVHVVAPDLRGHGHSLTVGPWTMAQHLEDLAPILRDIGPDTVVLGHSYGGLIAWELARAMPEALRGLVLVDPAIGVTAETRDWGIEATGSTIVWPDERTALEGLLAQREPTAWWAAALEFANTLEPAPRGEGLRTIVREDTVRAAWAHMHEPIRESKWRGPTLLLEAARENGKFVPPATLAAMKSNLGDALDHRIVNVTHTIPSDHPDLLVMHVTEFFNRLG